MKCLHTITIEGETAVSIALQHMRGEVPRPTKFNPAITPMLEECVLTALQKDPDKRYNSVSDFISELKWRRDLLRPFINLHSPSLLR